VVVVEKVFLCKGNAQCRAMIRDCRFWGASCKPVLDSVIARVLGCGFRSRSAPSASEIHASSATATGWITLVEVLVFGNSVYSIHCEISMAASRIERGCSDARSFEEGRVSQAAA
jgi:hypothetical protein